MSNKNKNWKGRLDNLKLGGHKDKEKSLYARGYDDAIDNIKPIISMLLTQAKEEERKRITRLSYWTGKGIEIRVDDDRVVYIVHILDGFYVSADNLDEAIIKFEKRFEEEIKKDKDARNNE